MRIGGDKEVAALLGISAARLKMRISAGSPVPSYMRAPRQQVSSLGFRRRRDLACRVHDCVHARPAATPDRPPQPLPSRPGTPHETRILAPVPAARRDQ